MSRDAWWLSVLTVLALLTRFAMLNHPRQVVFDEYHFGKFVNGYITGKYFFDIHPPLGKILIAAVGWMGGYDGSQGWEKIGDDIAPSVNLLALRGAPALQGSLLVPLMYATARALGISEPASLVVACGVLLDGCFLVESRLVLTDATLLLCLALQIFGCASAAAHAPLSRPWVLRTALGGLGVAGAVCTKWTGVSALGMAGLHTLVMLLTGLAAGWGGASWAERRGLLGGLLRHGFASAGLLLLLPMAMCAAAPRPIPPRRSGPPQDPHDPQDPMDLTRVRFPPPRPRSQRRLLLSLVAGTCSAFTCTLRCCRARGRASAS